MEVENLLAGSWREQRDSFDLTIGKVCLDPFYFLRFGVSSPKLPFDCFPHSRGF